MKRLLLILALLFPSVASAQIVNTLPFQLQNGTTADASQVMADFNQIVNNTNANAAKNGVNSDITALTGLTTPLSPTGGGTNQFVGGTSSGTNAYVVATTTPNNFSLTKGNTVTFFVGATNTGPSTLSAGSQAATNIYRRTSLGAIAMAGGEMIAGNVVSVIYDGTEFQLLSDQVTLIGDMKDFGGSAAPPGYFIEDGSCQSQTTYAALFSVIGTAFDPTGSTCDTAHFALPDTRGRMTAGVDGGAGRITVGGSNCAATLGLACGTQNQNIGQSNLPNTTISVTINSITVNSTRGDLLPASGLQVQASGGSPLGAIGGPGVAITSTGTGTGSTAALGSGTALTTLPPVQITNKIIKF
jgi:microcystin-dependent protein